MKNTAGKVVVITGASRGLGLALAEEFGKRGARLVLAARDAGELLRARRKLLSIGAVRDEEDVLIVPADLRNSEEAEGLIDEATRQHYAALYARPHAMHDAFEQFAAFNQDATDNKAFLADKGKLTMPVLALGGDKSFGGAQADTLRVVATNVTMGIIPDSGHWIMDENPGVTTVLTVDFLGK